MCKRVRLSHEMYHHSGGSRIGERRGGVQK